MMKIVENDSWLEVVSDKVDERYIHISDPSSNKKARCDLITRICEYK